VTFRNQLIAMKKLWLSIDSTRTLGSLWDVLTCEFKTGRMRYMPLVIQYRLMIRMPKDGAILLRVRCRLENRKRL
jgi:hypothetical protein